MYNFFNFKKFKDNILITNDIGFWKFLKFSEFVEFFRGEVKRDSDLYQELTRKHFILDGNVFVTTRNASYDLQMSKQYLRTSTSLHIFVLTNYCNMHCRYCQAQSENGNNYGFMTKEIAFRAVDIAFNSSDEVLTFEFQGGEPLLNFEVLKELIMYAENNKGRRKIFYMITTNATLLTDEIMDFFEKFNVSVSVSLDGHKELQDCNRPMNNGESSYDYIVKALPVLKSKNISGGAVITTSKYSLDKWKKIIDTYRIFGFEMLFIRPLTPLGFANDHWKDIGYTAEQFIEYYRKSLQYIIDLNKKGELIKESHACIFLRKILRQRSDNYMELRSPCGATLGQIAYYYDGNIYTCDEGRMLAQMGDNSFCLGNVFSSNYLDLINCDVCKTICKSSILEGLPACSDCVYMPYCGVCPATTYALEKNLFSRTYNNYRCKIYKGILDILFENLLVPENREILESWI